MTQALALHAVSHCFDDAEALQDVSLQVAPGECVALLGPSGAGKSTLLALLDGRVRGWRGRAEVLGNRLTNDRAPERKTRLETGFIFQEFALVDRQSVYQNAMNGRLGRMRLWPSLWGRYGAQDHLKTTIALEDTGLTELAQRRADQLSGGQRQRVAIARALIHEPALIVCDEPTSALDYETGRSVVTLLQSLAAHPSRAVFMVTHDSRMFDLADHVITMEDGRITK